MSALATYYHLNGFKIQGSDICENEHTKKLLNLGIKVFKEHNPDNLKNVDTIIYSGAISNDNEEIQFAINNNITLIERSKLLSIMCDDFKNIIAVAGTHGKTTTTAMISKVLIDCNFDPTIHIGGDFDYIGGNFKLGQKEYFVTEACEYKRSFLHLNPTYSIITNVELDHTDCYNNLEDIYNAFDKFAEQTKSYCFINGDTNYHKRLKTNNLVSFGKKKHNDYRMYNMQSNLNDLIFDIEYKQNYICTLKLSVKGLYNAYNALSCFAFCHKLNIPSEKIKKSLQNFENVDRRFTYISKFQNLTIYKDYAHHPTEIANLLAMAKDLKYKKVICFFQPHTYSRTYGLFNEFLKCFHNCDYLYLLPTYPAREKEIIGGRSEDLYEKLKIQRQNVYFLNNFEETINILEGFKNQNYLVLLVGAGNIEDIEKIIKKDI